ncbi:MAG TPA: TonB family protein [Steroidobacteraceae bacterium]|nr:TonB family protein [Steroidobacteraceae bacterium]
MLANSSFYRGSARRSAFGATIIAAHAGIIALFAYGTFVPPVRTEAPPLIVNVLEELARPTEMPVQSDPKLTPLPPVTIVVPDVAVTTEPDTSAITAVTAVDAPPAPPTPAPQPAATLEPPSMSEVAYLKQPSPHYPSESRRAREEGLVILRVLIDESGHASRIAVYRSSGHPRLDEAARDAVQRALFKPYINGGVARAAIAMVPVEFSLHG